MLQYYYKGGREKQMKLDYSLDSPEERKALVEKILEETPEPTPSYLESLADYLVYCMEKEERKQKKIITENRMTTINKRELSYEGLASQFENGEDGIYSLMNEDKNQLFQPKDPITPEDKIKYPELQQIQDAIDYYEKKRKTLSGRAAYIAKKAIIELHKDQYIVRNSLEKPVATMSFNMSKNYIPLQSEEWVDENGGARYSGVSLLNPKICSEILANYSALKEGCYGNFYSDTYYLMESFDKICGRALQPYPFYERIVELKIDGIPNADIKDTLQQEFGVTHTPEYISSLWRKKIPNLIASAAEDEFLDHYFLEEAKGQYKKCSKCGQIKLALPKYFSKNKTSKDGWYSICKDCRNLRPSEKMKLGKTE